jgi:hypothetical protein
MKSYVITTGIVFLLIVVAHIARVAFEGAHVASDPFFILTTLIAVGLCAWTWRLYRMLHSMKTS